MRFVLVLVAASFVAWSFSACGSSSAPKSFCDTACSDQPVKFNHPHPDSPFVTISFKGCNPDTISWSNKRLETTRKMGYMELVGKEARINKDFISCYFKDTSYAWLKYNDCITGRGFLVKLPYSKSDKWSIYTSALNNFDKKFSVEEGVIAYYDETFLYAQNMENGKIDRMLLNNTKLDIDHNNVHGTFDSINVSKTRIWANIKIDHQFQAKEKKIKIE